MILKVFSVFDSKVASYLQPFYCRSSGEAFRSWSEACNDPKSMMCRYPGDYTLFEIGTFDDSSCKFSPLPAILPLGLAQEFKQSSPAPGALSSVQ